MNANSNTDLLAKELNITKLIHRQIARISSAKDIDQAINGTLAVIGEVSGAEKVSIMKEHGRLRTLTYGWNADAAKNNTEAEMTSAESLIMIGEEVIGSIVVEGISEEMAELIEEPLNTLGLFMGIALRNAREHAQLQWSYEELRKNTDIENMLVNSVGIGIFAYTLPERRVLIQNTEARRMFDCSEEDNDYDFIRMIHEKIVPEDAESMRVVTSQLKEPGDHIEYSFHINKDNGERLTVKCNTKLMGLSDGRQYILSAMTDVTKQEKLETSLIKERRRYRDALKLDSTLSFTVDLNDGYIEHPIITDKGRNLLDEMGFLLPVSYDEITEVMLKKYHVVFLTKDANMIVSREWLMELRRKGVSHFSGECYISTRSKYYNVLVLLSDSEGDDHVNANFIVYDITSRKLDEEKEQSIIDSLSSIYYAVYYSNIEDNKCEAVKLQDRVEDRLPFDGTITDFVEVYLTKCVDSAFIDHMRRFLDTCTLDERFADTDVLNVEYQRKKIGWCRGTMIVTGRKQDGGVASLIFAVQEINAEKENETETRMALRQAFEAARQANKAKTDFLTNMSHDIRTPMNAIMGMTAIAEARIEDRERVQDCLGKIKVSGRHLLRLINEVLDMSKIESGQLELQSEVFSIKDMLEELQTISRPQTEAKHHEFWILIQELEHDMVMGDCQRIEQVLLNLIGNAVKYTPDGGRIKLSVAERSVNKEGIGCYEFIVEDNGIGMSEEFMTHLFEPFARAGDSRVEEVQGTGLGMSIARNIVEMMNGTIKAESMLNQGTRFIVTICLKLAESGEDSEYSGRGVNVEFSDKLTDLKAVREKEFSNRRALLVEDNRLNAEIAGEVFEMTGMAVENAWNGKEAVKMVTESEDGYYDIVFMDIQMPVMNGHEATRALRAIRREYVQKLPIIAMTANAFAEDVQASKNAGMNEHISKPLDMEKLERLMHRWLQTE